MNHHINWQPIDPHWDLTGNALIWAIIPVVYIVLCYMLKRIVEKTGIEPGFLIWVPVFNIIRLLQASGSSGWLCLLYLIPGINLVVGLIMWVKICQAMRKSEWWVLLMVIPIVNIFFIPYLAFCQEVDSVR